MARETYMDTLFDVVEAGAEGLAYAKLTRAQKVHVRSLVSDRYAAGFVGDEAATLDTEGVVICLTTDGESYVAAFQAAGLLAMPAELVEESQPKAESKPVSKPKPKRRTARKPKAAQSVKPTETKPIPPAPAPKGLKNVFVPGGSVDTRTVRSTNVFDRLEEIEHMLMSLKG